MDYAFVPGIGNIDLEGLRDALALRPNTVVSLTPESTTLTAFLGVLDRGIHTAVLSQAGDLILGAHGSDEGQLVMVLDPTSPPAVTYESLKKLNTTIQIPAGVGTANTSCRLASCLIGTEDCKPFLRLLKQALGNPKSVTVPRFVHSFYPVDGGGFFEAMEYEFWVAGPDDGAPLLTRDAVVKKFCDTVFHYFDGTEVPRENFKNWVPSAAKLNLSAAHGQIFDFPYPVVLPFGIIRFSPATWQWGHDKITLEPIAGADPKDDNAAKKKNLELKLPGVDTFKDSHLYPIYKRHHFNNLGDFIKGWHWEVTPAGTDKLQYVGTRCLYFINIPVTKPGTAEWIYNYYPPTGAPIINFTDDNQPYKLFGIV